MAILLKKACDNPEVLNVWSMEVTCGSIPRKELNASKFPCYSLIKIDFKDIVILANDRGMQEPHCYGFICPECGYFTEIDVEHIPACILEKATPRYTEN